MAEELTKEDIRNLILSGSTRIKYVNCNSKKLFKKVFVENVDTKFVKCIECIGVYIVKYLSGSNGLNRHETTHHSNVNGNKKNNQPAINFFVPSSLTQSEKDEVSRGAAVCASLDLLPFDFVEGRGMRHFVDVIAKICHKKQGKVSSKDLLCTGTTVGNKVTKVHNEIMVSMKEQLNLVDCIHATCDHWHETKTNRDFFTVTIHYLSNDMDDIVIKSSVIATIGTVSKTSEQIKKDYMNIVGSDSLDIGKKITSMTTDNASANISAFKHRDDLNWYSCCAHNLNLVLAHSFDIKKTDTDYHSLEDIDSLVKGCKELVTYVKRSGLNSELDRTLKQSVDTR